VLMQGTFPVARWWWLRLILDSQQVVGSQRFYCPVMTLDKLLTPIPLSSMQHSTVVLTNCMLPYEKNSQQVSHKTA